jgi:hypothetical protein
VLLVCLPACLPACTTTNAAGYPADANAALLDPSTAPRLLRLMEALLRTVVKAGNSAWSMYRLLPDHLPEMQLFYSPPSTGRAALCAVVTLTKCLHATSAAVAMVMQHPTDKAAAAAAIEGAVPGAMGAALAPGVSNPTHSWLATVDISINLANLAVRNLGRAALLLDPVSYEAIAAPAAAAAAVPAGRSSRAWLKEMALPADPLVLPVDGQPAQDLAAYKAQLVANPQLVQGIVQQLQPELAAMQQAAAVRQAALLAKQQGKDTAAIAERLQALQLAGSDGGCKGIGGDAATRAAAAAADATKAPVRVAAVMTVPTQLPAAVQRPLPPQLEACHQ